MHHLPSKKGQGFLRKRKGPAITPPPPETAACIPRKKSHRKHQAGNPESRGIMTHCEKKAQARENRDSRSRGEKTKNAEKKKGGLAWRRGGWGWLPKDGDSRIRKKAQPKGIVEKIGRRGKKNQPPRETCTAFQEPEMRGPRFPKNGPVALEGG